MKNLNVVARDAMGVVGALLVSGGAWMAWPPAGLIVPGAAMVFVAWRLAR